MSRPTSTWPSRPLDAARGLRLVPRQIRRGAGEQAKSVRPANADGVQWYWWFALGLFALYTVASVRLHLAMRTGFDLGIFEQDVRSWSEGRLPTSELIGPDFPRFGNHFSPVMALIAPVYKLFPSAVTVQVVHSALLAVAVVPLASWAQRALGRSAAIVVAAGYGLSWCMANTVQAEFHEVSFAVPLLAFSVAALGQRRPGAAVAWALPLLLVKEDLGVTTAAVGLLVWLYAGSRRLGLLTAAAGVLGSAVAFLVVFANSPDGGYQHAHTGGLGGGGYFAGLADLTVGLVTPEGKAHLVILLLAPTAFVALRSPLLLLAVPTMAWRLHTDYPNFYSGHYHYNAVLMPILFGAFVHGLTYFNGPENAGRRRDALRVCALVTALLLPANFLASPFRSEFWRDAPKVATARQMIAMLPPGAKVATTNTLVPQLTNRFLVNLYGFHTAGWAGKPEDAEWLLVDQSDWVWPAGSWQNLQTQLAASRAAGYRDVTAVGEFVLLQKSEEKR